MNKQHPQRDRSHLPTKITYHSSANRSVQADTGDKSGEHTGETDAEPDVDTSAKTHSCVYCGSQTEIQTPHIRVQNWCDECDGFQKFIRSDHYSDMTGNTLD